MIPSQLINQHSFAVNNGYESASYEAIEFRLKRATNSNDSDTQHTSWSWHSSHWHGRQYVIHDDSISRDFPKTHAARRSRRFKADAERTSRWHYSTFRSSVTWISLSVPRYFSGHLSISMISTLHFLHRFFTSGVPLSLPHPVSSLLPHPRGTITTDWLPNPANLINSRSS